MSPSFTPPGFASLGVPADLVSCLDRLGITDPYPIQASTLPEGLAGHDIFAQSPTGSGKTLAFAIPLVTRAHRSQPGRPRGLVLAPTRELAAQITEAILPLARVAGLRVSYFYGGTGYREQLTSLRRGVDIVVGCPGRLIDLVERRAVSFSDVEVVVIDEADRMADMGFLPPVRRLLDEIAGPRQTMLYSATRTPDVERLVRDYQKDPKRHVLELPSHDVGWRRHEFWKATREDRAGITAQLVSTHGSSIVFCRTKRGVDRLARQLSQYGVVSVALHGDRSQAQRDRALAQFKERRAQVLVGTDVASRGLHVDNVDCVIHYDPPEDEDTYVHRSGRTGRAGTTGLVVSLISSDQEAAAKKLHKRLGLDTQLALPPSMPATVPAPRQQPSGPAGRPTTRPDRSERSEWNSGSSRAGRSDWNGQDDRPGRPRRNRADGPAVHHSAGRQDERAGQGQPRQGPPGPKRKPFKATRGANNPARRQAS